MQIRTRALTWRWAMAVSGFALAVSLMAFRSYQLWMGAQTRVPGGFYDRCCLDLEMWETKVLNSINLPALILTAPVRIWWEHPIYTGRGFGVMLSDLAYLLVIAVFWWWVGKQLDDFASANTPKRSVAVRLIYYISTLLSMATTIVGFLALAMRRIPAPFYFGISCVLWGASLSVYLVFRLRSLPED
jgi:hypothetical protein